MGVDDIARDTQAQPDSAAIQIARLIKPEKSLEHVLAPILGNPRPVVVDGDFQLMVAALRGKANMLGVTRSVAQQIAETAPESVGAQSNGHAGIGLKLDLGAIAPSVIRHLR